MSLKDKLFGSPGYDMSFRLEGSELEDLKAAIRFAYLKRLGDVFIKSDLNI